MRFLVENLWLKLLALTMGLLVWFHVATDKTYTYQLKLPVTRVDLKGHYTLANLPPDSLMVSVSAKGKQLIRSAWRGEGIAINATRLPVGLNTINLTSDNTSLVNPSKSVRIDDIISPNPVDLNIDVESKAELPVVPDITAKTDDGFTVVGEVEITPPTVVVIGPKTIVHNIRSIHTEPRELGTLRNDVVIKAGLIPPTGFDMKLEPDSVLLAVHIAPVRTRVYERLPVNVYNAPSGRTVVTAPSSVQVELAGPPSEIELLNRNALTVSVDFRQRDPISGMASVKVDCPASFRVKRCSSDSVRLINTADVHTGN